MGGSPDQDQVIDLQELLEPRPAQVADLFHAFRDLLLKCRLYPEDHPSVQTALRRWMGCIEPFHREHKPLLFQSRDQRLTLNGYIVGRAEVAFEDARHCDGFLRVRGIDTVAFLPGLTAAETGRMIGMLHELPDGVKRASGLGEHYRRCRVTRVVCNPELGRGRGESPPPEAATSDPVVADRVDLYHGIAGIDEMPAQELAKLDTGEIDLRALDLSTFDFSSYDILRLNFQGVNARQIPEGALDFRGLAGPQLDELRFDFTEFATRDDLAGWDPRELFRSRLFLDHASGQGYRNFDEILREFLEAALAEAGTGSHEEELLARLNGLAEATSSVESPQDQTILAQRVAALIVELDPDAIVRFLVDSPADTKLLREQVLKALVHAHALSARVTLDLAERVLQETEGERFLLITEALEWLVPGRIADGDLAPALAALKAVNGRRMTADAPILIRTRATQLLRWLCRPDLLDRLLLGTIDGEAKVSRDSREVLLHLGPSAGDLLLAELKRSMNPEIRMVIVDLTAQLLSQEQSAGGTFTRSFRALLLEIEHADDHPWYYLRNLLLVIRKIGDEGFLEWIGRFLDSDDARVRQEALVACAQMKGEAARDMLKSAIEDVGLATPDALDAVCSALAGDPDFEPIAFLADLIDRSPMEPVRLAAVIRLATMDDEDVVDRLDPILNRKRGLIGRKPYYPEPLREAAARELARRDTPLAQRALRDLALDPSERVRTAARSPSANREVPPWEP